MRPSPVALDQSVTFDAGQFAVPGLAGYRAYSMTNFTAQTDHPDFVIKHKPGGGFSGWFGPGRAGSTLGVFGPLGKAT